MESFTATVRTKEKLERPEEAALNENEVSTENGLVINRTSLSRSFVKRLFDFIAYTTLSLDIDEDRVNRITSPDHYLKLLDNIDKILKNCEELNRNLMKGNGNIYESGERKNLLLKLEKDPEQPNERIIIKDLNNEEKYKSFVHTLISSTIFVNKDYYHQFIDKEVLMILKKLDEGNVSNDFIKLICARSVGFNMLRTNLQYWNNENPANTISSVSGLTRITRDNRTTIISFQAMLIKVYIQTIFMCYYLHYKLSKNGPKIYPQGTGHYAELIANLKQYDMSGDEDMTLYFKFIFKESKKNDIPQGLEKRYLETSVEVISPFISIIKDIRNIIGLLPSKKVPPSTVKERKVKDRVREIIKDFMKDCNETEILTRGLPFNFEWQVEYLFSLLSENIDIKNWSWSRLGFSVKDHSLEEKLQIILRVLIKDEERFLTLINWLDYGKNGAERNKPQENTYNMFIRASVF